MTPGPLPSSSVASTLLLGGPLTGKTTHLVDLYREHLQRGVSADKILCLSFFPLNAAAIRRALKTGANEFFPGVTTLQRFETLLLRDHAAAAGLPARAREVSPAARGLAIRRAWAEVAGPLWREFGERPGAVTELTRVIDWITQNRTRFAVAAGELGSHELAQVYGRYIALCSRHHWLTFQEASLRCIDLLADPSISAETRVRYPVVLVDDVHLARPDQLAVVSRLRALATDFAATARLAPDPQAPELRLIWQTMRTWGSVEALTEPAPGVNPVVPALVQRAFGAPGVETPVTGAPVTLAAEPTVEEELHTVAQAIVRALVADASLQPADIAVAAAGASLLPFAQRILANYGLPVAPLPPSPRHTPLIQGGLLALRWVKQPDSRLEIERDLLSLPYCHIDPLDLHTLYHAAEKLDKTILTLEQAELPGLIDFRATHAALKTMRECLECLDGAGPASQIIERAVSGLDGLAWAWEGGRSDFSQRDRDAWTSAFSAWVGGVAELEAAVSALGPAPDDLVDMVAALADHVGEVAPAGGPPTGGGIQLTDKAGTNGMHARLAFVVGLSENATPLLPPELQLITEDELPGLFGDGRAGVLPLARESLAWIEREARQLAALLSRGREQLHVSVSRFSAEGDAQLPSPFFERLLGADGEIDQYGNLIVKEGGLWAMAPKSDGPSPESRLPDLGRARPRSQPAAAAAQILTDGRMAAHSFSASQMRMYLTCPLQYFYGRVLGIEPEEVGTFLRGSVLHEVLCATLGDGTLQAVDLSQRKRPAWMNDVATLNARAQAALAAAWAGAAADLPGGGHYIPSRNWGLEFGPDLQQQAVRRWAANTLARWADFEATGRPDREAHRPVLLEMPFEMELGGYHLTGRIDRVDEVTTSKRVAYELVDYKTGPSGAASLKVHIEKFIPPEGAAPQDYQLPLYALALRQGVGPVRGEPRAVSLMNLEEMTRGKKGKFGVAACRTIEFVPRGEVDTKAGQVPLKALNDEVTQGIVATLGQMSLSPYPAKPDYHACQYCAFRAACDRGRAQTGERE